MGQITEVQFCSYIYIFTSELSPDIFKDVDLTENMQNTSKYDQKQSAEREHGVGIYSSPRPCRGDLHGLQVIDDLQKKSSRFKSMATTIE